MDAGGNSLREAIMLANGNPGADIIAFNIPGAGVHTITLLSDLPAIVEEVFIDGSTQPGYAGQPLIEINGNGIVNNVLEISAAATNTHISGLVINNSLQRGLYILAPDSRVTACYIGTNATATLAVPNGSVGIEVRGEGTIIGGSLAGEGNVISGNTTQGIFGYFNTDNIVVQGNYIGTDRTATTAIPNTIGILSWGEGLILGGNTAASRNIISGNTTGASLPGDKLIIKNNYFGTDGSGTTALPNTTYGLVVSGDSCLIGGLLATEANVISGNGTFGMSLSSSSRHHY